jgi:hypothetical protein
MGLARGENDRVADALNDGPGMFLPWIPACARPVPA